MKSSPNLTIVNFVLLGYVLVMINLHCLSDIYAVPNLLIILIYFIILAVCYKAKTYLVFALTSFMFLTFFFSFISFKDISPNTMWEAWFLDKKALKLYAYLLLPCLFMTYTINFYLLSEEIGRYGKKGYLRFFIPVLVKRELILHRYNKIIDALWIKGYNSKGTLGKLKLLPAWIVPLIVTTLMEGAESYEYNQMLQTKITEYTPTRKTYYYSVPQKLVLITLIFSFSILLVLYYV